MWTTRWVARDPIKVVDEIEGYVRQYGATNFPFQDLTAILKRDWIIAFCRALIDRKLNVTWQFPTGTRCEVIDREVARLLKESGMVNLNFAPESGSEETRKVIRKQMRTEPLMKSIEAAVGEGLNVSLFLVLGFPSDTPRSVAENIAFVRQAARLGVDNISVGYYMALPGTELYRQLESQGKIKLDRRYFRHILQGLALTPLLSFSDEMGSVSLAWWKARLYFAFYREKGMAHSIALALSGIAKSGHASKLQTALRNYVSQLGQASRALMATRWIPRKGERRIFAALSASRP